MFGKTGEADAMGKRRTATSTLVEVEDFLEDRPGDTEVDEHNTALANQLNGLWNPRAIVRIERIEIGSRKGWRLRYRT
jgi:hypothetical protein